MNARAFIFAAALLAAPGLAAQTAEDPAPDTGDAAAGDEGDAEASDETNALLPPGIEAPAEQEADAADVDDAPVVLPPVDLTETPSIPVDPEDRPTAVVHDEEQGWVPSTYAMAGLYLTDLVQPGVGFGAGFELEEHGPNTDRPHLDGDVRVRRVLFGLDTAFGFDPGNGLDRMDVRLTPYIRRLETVTRDGSERRRTDLAFGVFELDKEVEWDRDLGVVVSTVGANAARSFHLRGPISLGVATRSTVLGFEHVEYSYAPAHYFNGIRLASAAGELVPTFDLSDTTRVRYVLGAEGAVALGARNGFLVGRRFVTLSTLSAHTGVGLDVTRHLSFDVDAAYRSTIDGLRDNRSGWNVGFIVTGRY